MPKIVKTKQLYHIKAYVSSIQASNYVEKRRIKKIQLVVFAESATAAGHK